MVLDLESSTELLARHDLIAALAGDQHAVDLLRGATAYAPAPADAIKPEDEYPVQTADSSQRQAIETVMAGHHLVIEGPPGTGKSQTIANIIASAAAKGWRVLFVAEKRAAIEAVTDRLQAVGLDDLVLDLHRSTINKKHVAQQLSESLAALTQEPPVDLVELHRVLAQRRDWLSSYSREFHDPRAPWDRSAYRVREELVRLGDEGRTACTFRGLQLHTLDAGTEPRVREDLRTYVELGGVRVLRRESPWWRAEVTEKDLPRVVAELYELPAAALHQATDQMRHLLAQVGLPMPGDFTGWQRALELLEGVAASIELFGPEIFDDHLDALHYATAPRAERNRHGMRLPWGQRRALAKQSRRMCTTGMTRRADLHRALTEALTRRAAWRHVVGPGSTPTPTAGLTDMMSTYQRLRTQLAAVALSASLDGLDTRPTHHVVAALDELRADKDTLTKLPDIIRLRRRFEALGLGALLAELAERNSNGEQAALMFRHAWLRGLDEEFTLSSAYLRQFTASQHDRLVDEFQTADREHGIAAVRRVRRRVAVNVREARDDYPAQTQVLRREASKTRRLMPLRKLVEETSDVLLALRPCWAMSPLVVSRTLPASVLFDLVIFDEASQVKPQDAITSIMRGKRLVVTGDEKQLPPSSFFDRQMSGATEDEEFDLGNYDSILTSLRPVIPQHRRLRWHYRSQDERLIAFSNDQIYHRDLVTFPGTQQQNPLRLVLVNGIASPGQGGLPAEEVRRVTELVLEHAEQRPDQSLGVITLSAKHQDRVDAAIRNARGERPDLDGFFAEDIGPNRRFFVKNIETVQGDERDAIILSVGVGRRPDGTVSRTSFGPFNQQVGARRLNVAVTRARRRMTVVSSFPSTALAPSPDSNGTINGTELLRRFLEMAEHEVDPSEVGRAVRAEPNGFEQDIASRLEAADVPLYPQWGVSHFAIDLALAHPAMPGRMVLAVEADGDRYHRAESARDRDRLRQEHLERLGWRFHRVWASAWFADPEMETQKIITAWRTAVADCDAEQDRSAPTGIPSAALRILETLAAARSAIHRGPSHHVPPGLTIDDYTDRQLIAVCRWLISDGLAVDREDRIRQAMHELGFKRKGRKIVERVTRAVLIAQDQADRTEG